MKSGKLRLQIRYTENCLLLIYFSLFSFLFLYMTATTWLLPFIRWNKDFQRKK